MPLHLARLTLFRSADCKIRVRLRSTLGDELREAFFATVGLADLESFTLGFPAGVSGVRRDGWSGKRGRDHAGSDERGEGLRQVSA